MRIVFARVLRGECLTTFYRLDGVVVALPSYSRKHRVPHDLAHAVCERELGLAGGVFGTVAAGGLFDNVRVMSGKVRHDASARSERVLRANRGELGASEALAGALHDVVEDGHPESGAAALREAWSVVAPGPIPFDDAVLERAARTLDELGHAWDRVLVGHGMEFEWPDRLVRAVPRPEQQRDGGRPRSRR